MKKFFFYLFVTLTVTCLGQNAKKIKSDDSYYWAESGLCSSIDDAEDKAIDNLLLNIADNYKANAIYLPNDINQKTQLRNIIKTFKNKVNESSGKILVEEDFDKEKFNYMSYIKKTDFEKLCKEREDNIRRCIQRGDNANSDDRLCLEDALRFYYWSLMLCYAHPCGNNLKIKDEDEKEWRVEDYLRDKIDGDNGILKSFRFIVPPTKDAITETKDGILVKMSVSSTSGQPVSNLRYQFFNGYTYRSNTVHDGLTAAELLNAELDGFNVRIDYEFKDESKTMNSEVYEALNLIDRPVKFSNVNFKIDLDKVRTEIGKIVSKPEKPDKTKPSSTSTDKELEKIMKQMMVENENVYLEKIKRIEQAFRDRKYDSVRDCFSDEGYEMLMELAKYGTLTVLGTPKYKFLEYNDEVLCRSIPMCFDFKNNVAFNRDMVFRFDIKTKKVTSIAFRLTDIAEADILSHDKWPVNSKLAIINFMEDYQTAYALKRRDYLKQIYSENALIIVGHVLKTKPVNNDRVKIKLPEEQVEFIRQSKQEYMERLERVFNQNDYININFTETEFKKSFSSVKESDESYGIRVRQDYFSRNYGDTGYLFLYVDLNGKLPVIHVRAWQPDETDIDQLMKLNDVEF